MAFFGQLCMQERQAVQFVWYFGLFLFVCSMLFRGQTFLHIPQAMQLLSIQKNREMYFSVLQIKLLPIKVKNFSIMLKEHF